jgi:protocatechuate 3,4-dioxygenase beta subunit
MHPRAVIIAVLLLTAALSSGPAGAQNRGDCQGKQAETWSITIAGPDEPGRRMVVEGRVLASDGETPIAGATVFVFHTDDEGYYSPGGMEESDARLCGLMLTDPEGHYRFDTVKPGHYATGGPPAHVHYRVWGPELSRQSFSLNFEGDPLLGERGKDASANPTWATIRPATESESGVLFINRDLRTKQ